MFKFSYVLVHVYIKIIRKYKFKIEIVRLEFYTQSDHPTVLVEAVGIKFKTN